MEIVIDFLDLGQILVLHLSSGIALSAWRSWIWEYNLVDNNVFDIYLLFCQFNRKTFSFVHTQEFWDANSNECGLVWVFELSIDFINFLFNSIKSIIHLLVKGLWVSLFPIGFLHGLHCCNHARKLLLELNQLDNTLFQNLWEV